MIKTKNIFSISMISTFRQPLMGMAILCVLDYHFFGMSHINPTGSLKIIESFHLLLFTQAFLFLSGFGVYYSLSKDDNLLSFYRKRIYRLFLPFILMMIPYYIIEVCLSKESVWCALADLTTVRFWFTGEGLWYIAASVALYVLSPVIWKMGNRTNHLFVLVMSIIISIVLEKLLGVYAPNYYSIIHWVPAQYTMYFIGMFAGYLYFNHMYTDIYVNIAYFISPIILYIIIYVTGLSDMIGCYTGQLKVLISMNLICMFLNLIQRFSWSQLIFKASNWFGIYTLEIYILHTIFIKWMKYLCPDMTLIFNVGIGILLSIVFAHPVRFIINKSLAKHEYSI